MAAPVVLALIEALKASINTLTSKIDAAIAFADKGQEASLALGRTFEQTRKTLGPQLEGLRGSLSQRFEAGIKTLEAGMQGNTQGVSRLINQQMLTNTAFRNTATSFAKLEMALGLSRQETNQLAEVTMAVGNTYSISTDKLVETISALQETMPIQKLAGFGVQFQQAIEVLQAEVGPQAQQDLITALKIILDPALENLPTLSILGMNNIREQLAASRSTAEQVQLLKTGIRSANEMIGKLSSGAPQFYGAASVPLSVMKNQILSFVNLSEGLKREVSKSEIAIADYYKTLNVMKKEFWVPIELALTALHKPLLEVYEVLVFISKVIGEEIGKMLNDLLGTSDDGIKSFKLSLLNLGKTIAPLIIEFFRFVTMNFLGLFRSAVDFFIDALIAISLPGGPLDTFQVALYDMIAGIYSLPIIGDTEKKKEYQNLSLLKQIELAAGKGVDISKVNDLIYQANTLLALGVEQYDIPKIMAYKGFTLEQMKIASIINDLKAAGMTAKVDKLLQGLSSPDAQKRREALMSAKEDLAGGAGLVAKKFDEAIERLNKGLSLDEQIADASERAADALEGKTDTSTYFMDQTAELLAASMDRILGIRGDTTPKDMLEQLEKLNSVVGAQQLLNSNTPSVLGRGVLATP